MIGKRAAETALNLAVLVAGAVLYVRAAFYRVFRR